MTPTEYPTDSRPDTFYGLGPAEVGPEMLFVLVGGGLTIVTLLRGETPPRWEERPDNFIYLIDPGSRDGDTLYELSERAADELSREWGCPTYAESEPGVRLRATART